jgi:hypothetical protein
MNIMHRYGAILVLGLLLSATHGVADRIHLKDGGVIDAESWRIEGDTFFVVGSAGTVGIPRSEVILVEENSDGDDDLASRPVSPASSWPAPEGRASDKLVALFREAVAALDRREFEEASAMFLDVIRDAPEVIDARVGYAVCEIALGRDDRALPVVLDGLAQDPSSAELHEVLGDLRDREERVEEALWEWKESFSLSPNDRVREKIMKAEREIHAGRDYEFTATAHFNLRFDGEVDSGLAEQVVDVLETHYRELADEFIHAPMQPITVILYPDQQFRDVTQVDNEIAGLYDGKIRLPLGGLRSLGRREERVLRHELTHAVVHSKTRGNCPRWLHEGLAQRMEPRRPSGADLRSIRELLSGGDPSKWQDRAFSYPAALSLTLHLESRRGFPGVIDILEALGRGLDIDEALHDAFGEDYAEICKRWAEEVLEGSER